MSSKTMHDIVSLQSSAWHFTKVGDTCVGGIVVSIAAFQAVDPGSIPGQRNKVSLDATVLFAISLLGQLWAEEHQ